ncbi:MAG: DNA recombination protein RmuC [Lentisphaeria bacterium]|nr:DNA recombination protein RmuC [Lentisphaeria bacterium]
MQWSIVFFALLAGAGIGSWILHLISAKRQRDAAAELETLRLKNVEMQTALNAIQQQHNAEKQLLTNSFEREKQLIEESHCQKLKMLQQHSERSFAELEKTHQARLAQLREECNALSNKILEEKSGKLQAANKEQLELLLSPLREKMGEFKTAVEESKNKGIELAASLTTQLGKMMEETCRIGTEARSLANALKSEQKTQGNWGELILEDILNRSGLISGLHYERQETIRDTDGNAITGDTEKKMRPDVIIHYPDGKDVIIDSKVSLSAYVDYMNSDDTTVRQDALDRHLRSVRTHVNELARKDYSAYNSKSGRDTVDFVIMFIPNEGPYQLAMISDPNLWGEAFKNKVMIVSPVNLMALLKIIHISWTREEQSRNQQDILDTAAVLLDRLYAFYEDFDQIGSELEKLHATYEKALHRLKQGERNHSIVNTGEKLKRLGVRMNKQRKSPKRLELDDIEKE